MKRKEFLSKLSLGAAFALTASCMGGCTSDPTPTPSSGVDFEVDLSDSANAALLNNGGYVVKNRIVVAKDNTGAYVAATQLCSHENLYRIVYQNGGWYCNQHGAKYNLNGEGLNSEGKRGIAVYQTELNGNILHVFA